MRFILSLALILSSSLAFAGGDNASTTKCEAGKYKLKIKRKGSFFGEDRIVLQHGWSRLSEEYQQDWSPEGNTAIEKLALKELPCSSSDFYQFLESASTYVLQSYPGGSTCEDAGEIATTYVQLKSTGQILKFTDCEKD
ncbi:hypothetical protein EZJ49_07500 [Bdellovibrio bacteriovorus]|uniref:hypothetical protein n=1 Tax=Bdellovibrio bacteriovorus TaxID=959 RepID=UPI0021D33F5C|nr:hypothetical protein [Bdellovibrio bacteriovorus]UXR66093.1 hypothetical protein EZJ49_07500 [Bdellovibrio bacteriovorus]